MRSSILVIALSFCEPLLEGRLLKEGARRGLIPAWSRCLRCSDGYPGAAEHGPHPDDPRRQPGSPGRSGRRDAGPARPRRGRARRRRVRHAPRPERPRRRAAASRGRDRPRERWRVRQDDQLVPLHPRAPRRLRGPARPVAVRREPGPPARAPHRHRALPGVLRRVQPDAGLRGRDAQPGVRRADLVRRPGCASSATSPTSRLAVDAARAAGHDIAAFLPVVAPASVAYKRQDVYYGSEEEYVVRRRRARCATSTGRSSTPA